MIAFLKLFSIVPGWLWATICAGAIAASFIQGQRLEAERLDHIGTKLVLAEQRETYAAEALKLSQYNRQLEMELNDAKTQNETQAAALLAAIDHANAIAAVANQRLRDAAEDAADAARARCTSAGTPGLSTPGGDPIGVLADVLGRADQRAGELAAIADRSRAAGLTCERAYETAREALNRPS